MEMEKILCANYLKESDMMQNVFPQNEFISIQYMYVRTVYLNNWVKDYFLMIQLVREVLSFCHKKIKNEQSNGLFITRTRTCMQCIEVCSLTQFKENFPGGYHYHFHSRYLS